MFMINIIMFMIMRTIAYFPLCGESLLEIQAQIPFPITLHNCIGQD